MGTQKEKEARSADSSPLLRALVLTGLCLLHCGLQWSIVQWDAHWGAFAHAARSMAGCPLAGALLRLRRWRATVIPPAMNRKL